MHIRILPEHTANRIAAGEVVERPAAVVKELVENALDAGALSINVEIEQGGIQRILVEDDGRGMGPEDLDLCVERHATSKLPDDDALFRISTLGFRGEALPSIGAVAKLAISSKPEGSDAYCVKVEAGHKTAAAPTSARKGTRVEVCDLFYAVPARLKFMKSPRTEANAAEDALRRLAMAWPQVRFRMSIDGREVMALPPADRDQRAKDILGTEFSAVAQPLRGEHPQALLSGLVALPTLHKATGDDQFMVVNGRPLKDPVLKACLRAAYRETVPSGRFPVAAVFLEVPHDAVDVNVHPAKSEVRFRDADLVRGALISAIKRAIGVGAGSPSVSPPPPIQLGPNITKLPREQGKPLSYYVPSLPLRSTPRQSALQPAQGYKPWRPDTQSHPFLETADRQSLNFDPEDGVIADLPSSRPIAMVEMSEQPMPDTPWEELPLGAPVMQLHSNYIIARAADDTLIIVDQHAAHERITQEKLTDQLTAGGVVSQTLLLPTIVDLAPAKLVLLLERQSELLRFGFEIEGFGAGAVMVRAVPALIGSEDPMPMIRDFADQIASDDGGNVLEARLIAAISRLACHGSIRSGRKLTQEEMSALLRSMEATPRASTCSHGRPTFVKLSKTELEKMFGRR